MSESQTSMEATAPIPSVPRGRRLPAIAFALTAALFAATVGADRAAAAPAAGAWLVFDARSGEVVSKHDPDQLWYPASITKLMTTWVTLEALRAGRIRPTTPVVMSKRASREPPSKMGFAPGQSVTVDNALKIIMVKSANDVAWALGETVSGSKEAFVAEMNAAARRLGMRRTRWNNPNGLPDPEQTTTARDLGILARALLFEFPEADELWRLPGIQIGNEVVRNHNHLIDHFPGSDGMKTGFICASGFNVVATATRGNRRLVAVVLGSRSARQRAELAAELFSKGFERGDGGLFARFSVPETIETMTHGPESANPVRDVRQEICGKKRGETPPDVEDLGAEPTGPRDAREAGRVITPGSDAAKPRRTSWLSPRFEIGPPVRVWVGGPEDAPADAGRMLALTPDAGSPLPAPIAAAPAIPAIPIPAPADARRPGALGNPQSFALFRNDGGRSMPPADAAGKTGIEASLPPSDGRPLVIGGPAAAALSTPAAVAPPPQKVVAPPPRAARAKAAAPPPPNAKEMAKRLSAAARLAPKPKQPAVGVPTPVKRPKPPIED
jgi:D-alanyl-D-alanine carboxypeptidase